MIGTAFAIRANFQKVSSILNYHATKATQASNDKAGKMAELAKSDNNLMLKMTKKSVTDARTLKTITILTLVYLPASFVSVSCPRGEHWMAPTDLQADISGHELRRSREDQASNPLMQEGNGHFRHFDDCTAFRHTWLLGGVRDTAAAEGEPRRCRLSICREVLALGGNLTLAVGGAYQDAKSTPCALRSSSQRLLSVRYSVRKFSASTFNERSSDSQACERHTIDTIEGQFDPFKVRSAFLFKSPQLGEVEGNAWKVSVRLMRRDQRGRNHI